MFASMGSVAASGGYWIASQCDAIYASPMTITGSIGVIGGNVAIGDMLKSYGVDADGYTTHESSTPALAFYHGLSESQRDVSRRLIDRMYDYFVKRVSVHRTDDGDVSTIERVARGRVWLGSQAERNGLIERAAPFVPSAFRRSALCSESGEKKNAEDDESLPLMEIYPKVSDDFWTRLRTSIQISRGGGGGPYPPSAMGNASFLGTAELCDAYDQSVVDVLERALDDAASITPLERLAATAGNGSHVLDARAVSDGDAGFVSLAEAGRRVLRDARRS